MPLGLLVFIRFFRTVSTDDARIDGHVLTISARVSGSIAKILVEDDTIVKAGQPLVEIDPVDFNEAAEERTANVAELKAALQVARNNAVAARVGREERIRAALQGLAAANSRKDAAVAQEKAAAAEMVSAEARLTAVQSDFARTSALYEQHLVSRQVFTNAVGNEAVARKAVDSERAAVDLAQANVQSEQANLGTAKIAVEQAQSSSYDVQAAYNRVGMQAADLQLAEAQLSKAHIMQTRTIIRSPVAGIVSARVAELGENVQQGDALLSVVDTSNLWVTANFKETQLKWLAVGLPVQVTVDAYQLTLPGRITGFGGGSGSLFSLLPPDNASGNYVKVVQRIPVRILLEERFQQPLLRPGMSGGVRGRHAVFGGPTPSPH